MPPFDTKKCVQFIIDEVENNHTCSVETAITKTSNYGASEGLIEQVKSAVLAIGGYEATQRTNFGRVNYYISKIPVHGQKETPPTSVAVTAGILNLNSKVENQYQDSSSDNSINANPPKHKKAIIAKTILKWFFIILGGIAAFLTITKLGWNWP